MRALAEHGLEPADVAPERALVAPLAAPIGRWSVRPRLKGNVVGQEESADAAPGWPHRGSQRGDGCKSSMGMYHRVRVWAVVPMYRHFLGSGSGFIGRHMSQR